MKMSSAASATSERSRMTTRSWSKLFPSRVDTQSESLAFVKRLVAVGVSNIIYLRGNFPDSAFNTHDFEGLTLKILNAKNGAFPAAAKLCSYVQSAMEAVEKGFLKEMVLFIGTDPELMDRDGKAVETYVFCFEYSADGAIEVTFNDNRLTTDID